MEGQIAALRSVIEAKDGTIDMLRVQLAASEEAAEQARRQAQEAQDAAAASARADAKRASWSRWRRLRDAGEVRPATGRG